ncbi:hypothetical protein LguiA_032456 [Lonicera macranthoides]
MPGNGRAGKRKGGGEVVAAAAAAEVVVEWEEWGLWNTSEAYVNELYGEVVWDEDIWDLKAINHIPNP